MDSGGTPPVSDPDVAQWPTLSRRAFLRLCGVTSAGLAVGGCGPTSPAPTGSSSPSTTESEPALSGASPAAAPLPGERSTSAERLSPFESADWYRVGPELASSSGSALPSGALAADVDFTVDGDGSLTTSVYSFVRWTFVHQGTEAMKATVSMKYTLSVGERNTHSNDPFYGYGQSWVQIGITVRDTGTGDTVDLVIEEHGSGQMIVPVQYSEAYKGQETPVTFKPGRTYQIEGYLVAGGSLVGKGSSKAHATATISGLRLLPMTPPWIRTKVLSVSAVDSDTYDLLQRGLRTAGRDYYLGAALLEISAGGAYSGGRVDVSTQWNESRIVDFLHGGVGSATSLTPYFPPNKPNTASLQLPSSASLPLEGKTWRVTMIYDPHFQKAWDYLLLDAPDPPVMPLFLPVVGMWADVDRASLEYSESASASAETVLVSRSRVAGLAPQVVTPEVFFSLENYGLVMRLSRFQDLTLSADARVPSGATPLPVRVYVPPGVTLPRFDSAGLSVRPLTSLAEGLGGAEASTEPLVVVSLADLWAQFVALDNVITRITGLEWAPTPRFIELLTRIGEREEAFEEYLKGLYWMPRSGGPAIALEDIPDFLVDRVTGPGGQSPLWVSVPGGAAAVAVVLSPRLRRWARRVVTYRWVRDFMEANRPVQDQVIRLSGEVDSTAAVPSEALRRVFFDVVPQRYGSRGVAPDVA